MNRWSKAREIWRGDIITTRDLMFSRQWWFE